MGASLNATHTGGVPGPVSERIENKLRTMQLSVDKLAALGAVGPDRLASEPAIGLAIERNLSLLLDLAMDIGTSLPTRLCPEEGPYHVQVQLCLDTEPERVAGLVRSAVEVYGDYLRRMAG